MTKEDIEHLARLARVRLSGEEVAHFQSQITSILEYVSAVNAIVADEATAPAAGAVRNVLRPDAVTVAPESYTETLLAAAPKRQGRFVAVKKILQIDE